MNQIKQIIYMVFMLLLVAGMASGNTLFSKQEWKILDNWNNDKVIDNAGRPEGYSEPEDRDRPGLEAVNTLFSKEEWKIVKNWNNYKAISTIGKAEGYSEPSDIRQREFKMSNTFFGEGEWQTLKKWNAGIN